MLAIINKNGYYFHVASLGATPTQLSMNDTLAFLVRHGTAVLIVAVFIEQVGAPLPAAPWLFAAGALVGAGKMNWMVALGAAAFGSLLADTIWFYLGRRYGNHLLGLLCRISLTPDACVRRTQNVFARYGMRGVVAAKFIPGLSTLAPPLAGSSGITAPRFILFDGMGSLLYVGCFLLVGVLFSHQLEQIMAAFASLGGNALGLVAGLVVVYIGYKYFQRRRLLRALAGGENYRGRTASKAGGGREPHDSGSAACFRNLTLILRSSGALCT